jgi:hypothetical protein
MALAKKTTVLFPAALYRRLSDLARQRKVSVGHLVRNACEAQYGFAFRENRLKAVKELSKMSLPVGSPAQMKRESVADPRRLL